VAVGLSRQEASVAVGGRTASKVESVRDEIIAAGGNALATSCDVSVREEVEAFVATTAAVLGHRTYSSTMPRDEGRRPWSTARRWRR
jgi:NADP-dependent 3-hydroxy acid dehydrogenase YdfG